MFTPGKLILAVPSKDTPPIVLAVSNLVADIAFWFLSNLLFKAFCNPAILLIVNAFKVSLLILIKSTISCIVSKLVSLKLNERVNVN